MKRALKIIGWTLLSIVLVIVAAVTIACYVIFTPARLTPIARQVADKYVVCDHEIGEVDLTFFSTFPYFGASVKDVVLINPVTGAQSDTVLAVPELVVSLKILDAINGDIYIQKCRLNDAKANIYIASDGLTNFDILALPQSEETPEDTTAGWQLKSLGWDDAISIKVSNLSFFDEKDTISASLQNASIALEAIRKNGMDGARLDLQAEHLYAALKGETYASDMCLKLHLPALLAQGSERVIINGTELKINEFGLSLDGEVGSPCLSSGVYNMDLTLNTGKWDIESLLALVPAQFTQALADLSLAGTIQLEADVKGQYADTLLPRVQAHVRLEDGAGAYKPLPYELKDVTLDAEADINLNKGQKSNAVIHKLHAATRNSQFTIHNSQLDDLMGNMLLDLALKLDANLPDFAYFLPKEMTLNGRAKGNMNAKIRLKDLTDMRLEKGKITADLDLKDIHYAMDSMVADLPSTHAVLAIPNAKPSKPKVNWARIDLDTKSLDFQMATPLKAALKASTIQLEAGNVLSKDPVLYAAVGLQSERMVEVEMDSMGGTIDAPKLSLYAEYNTKDTTVMPVAQLALDCDALDGFFKETKANMAASKLTASLSGGRKDKSAPRLKATLDTKRADVRMGEELKAKAGSLALEVGARYNAKENNILLQWNPRLKINLKSGEVNIPDRLPEAVHIPSIEFSYSNREMTIDNSRIELGNSDLSLSGSVRNIGKWFRHKEILSGELNILSNHCDANQLLAWFSANSGSEETPQTSETQTAPSKKEPEESSPFLVPKDVDLALHTNMQEVEIFNQTAKNLQGGIFVKNGTLILDEVGFVCRAAKLQLTAMYRTPRRSHLYVGLDYHMIDVDIDELLTMIPNLEEMVPMLSSFKGAAQFHLAAETYLNSQYQPKMSTLRGAASLTGKDLVVLDSETFDQIAKLLRFKKKTENRIDSINAELTVYKNEIDVYPLCVQMDNYMVALGGRHNTNMTFDYDINVLSPIYLGVNVSGSMDDLKIKLAKCKFAKDFRPRWFDKTDTQSLELRQRIKSSMEKNVRIQ
ncbi:MAG: AsmA family protein [Paludibacteraceae bacterium]|nr:AsmA family protein [Paludibacteraceae bacterium]